MVLVVMSHGEEGGHSGRVLTSNGERIDIEHDIFRWVDETFITKSNVKCKCVNVYRVFNNYCTQLIDIPKLFIIQACKGSQLGVGVTVEKSGEKFLCIHFLEVFLKRGSF